MTLPSRRVRYAGLAVAAAALVPLVTQSAASAAPARWPGRHSQLQPGTLLLSAAVYPRDVPIAAGRTTLPGGETAVTSGGYPQVFNNASVDGDFGIAARIVLDELTGSGRPVTQIALPDRGASQVVTSFSSKSELSLNRSTLGQAVSFIGYDARPGDLDVSNSDTPGAPGSGSPAAYYRVIASLNQDGRLSLTRTNAFSGDNGRAAIRNDAAGLFYAAGNAGDHTAAQIEGSGAQLIHQARKPEPAQRPGTATPVGSFSVTELGYPQESGKFAKDNNYRGITVHDNVLYYTKGSGGKGVSTVYFVDTTGRACPSGTGLPGPGTPLPVTPLRYDPALVTSKGLTPENMCVLAGFPSTLNKKAAQVLHPFGIWFANSRTIYLADEGDGDNSYAGGTYTAAAASTTAGLQKWVLDTTTRTWKLAYVLQSGLDLGTPYQVPGYPAGINSGPGGTGLPWAPATDGLRDIAGRVNRNGTVTVWAVTSTVSGSGDQGADPDKLVEITDQLSATSAPSGESFRTLRTATDGTLFRGISFTPGR